MTEHLRFDMTVDNSIRKKKIKIYTKKKKKKNETYGALFRLQYTINYPSIDNKF